MLANQTSDTVSNTVAVVGTGVVGLASALGCAQLGMQVLLIGPAPREGHSTAGGAQFDPRIYALSPAAVSLLQRQRAWAQIDTARVQAVAGMQVFGDDGARLRFDAQAVGVPALASICEESALLQALWLGCKLAPGVTHIPQPLESAAMEAQSVRLYLAGGTTRDCALLLGADGKRSVVRAAAGINVRISPYGHTAIVANFSCERPHDAVAQQWFTHEGVVALLPLPGNHVSLVWSAPPALAAELQNLAPDDFARRVALRSAHALGALKMLGERHAFVLEQLVVERMVRPGVALLGDAAHVVHPLAGQGLNLGLGDVSELLRVLSAREPWRTLNDMVCLRRYERARAEPIALMRTTVGALARLFAQPDARVRWLRNTGMRAVDALSPVKHALIRHAIG